MKSGNFTEMYIKSNTNKLNNMFNFPLLTTGKNSNLECMTSREQPINQ